VRRKKGRDNVVVAEIKKHRREVTTRLRVALRALTGITFLIQEDAAFAHISLNGLRSWQNFTATILVDTRTSWVIIYQHLHEAPFGSDRQTQTPH
jgi:ABC-type lipopolysaccharide export system ATPase subunit